MDTSTRYAYIRSTKKKKNQAMFGDQASGRRELGETLSNCSCEGLGQSFGSAPREDGTIMPGIVWFMDDGSTGSISTLDVEYTDKNDKYKIGVPFREPKPLAIPPGGWGMQDMHGARMVMGASISQQAGRGKIKIENDSQISEEASTKLSTADSGFITRGIVMRDVRSKSLGKQDDSIIDHDRGNLNAIYSYIGRNPYRPVSKLFSMGIGMFPPINRNPPLSEKLEVLFEYPKEYHVSEADNESELLFPLRGKTLEDPKTVKEFMDYIGRTSGLSDNKKIFVDNDSRTNKRYNVFNFDDPNKLIERIEGTGVDFYGNIIDINRQVIAIKEDGESNSNAQNKETIRVLNRKHRRGIMYHVEMNSRKELDERENNKFLRKDLSRWMFDIDKEGLTKVNFPASSEVGSIPILTRYGSYDIYNNDAVDIDISGLQFGTQLAADYEKPPGYDYSGITIAGSNLIHNAAYHNVLTTASRIIANSSYPLLSKTGPTFYNSLSVKNLISKEDCGGRSFLGNLDGSLEMSVGADTIDKKSLVLDTAGAIINRIGRDKNGRSIVTQTDGDMIIQIGGMGPRDSGTSSNLKDPSTNRDPRFSDEDNSFRAGALILQIVTSESHDSRSKVASGLSSAPSSVTQDQFIRITKDGMEVFINGNLVFDVMGSIEMAAQGDVTIRGSSVKAQSAHTGGGKGAPSAALVPGVPNVKWPPGN